MAPKSEDYRLKNLGKEMGKEAKIMHREAVGLKST